MKMVERLTSLMCAAIMLIAVPGFAADGISDGFVKIGVLNDMSGTYADFSGAGSVYAAKMAIDDFGGKVLDKPIQLVSEDHKNKADIAANIAQKWYGSDKVDVIMDLTNSGCALAVVQIAKNMNRIAIASGPASSNLTNENCTPNSVHWTFDTYSNSVGTATAVLKNGGDTWCFLTADYPFGLSMEKETMEVVKANSGKIIDIIRHPLSTLDFSSYLVKARASGAKIIGLANAGADTINAIRQAGKLKISETQTLVGLVLTIREIHDIGLEDAQGLMFTTAFYWDFNDETRAWANRFFENQKKMPNMVHAGVYSSVLHYLKAVNEAGTDDPAAVMAEMRKIPVNDMFAKNGIIRDDGRMVHDMLLVQVKKPSESAEPWDYLKVIRVIPGTEAFQPLEKSRCPALKK